MNYDIYSPTVRKWINTIIENVDTNGELTLSYCKDIIEYGQENKDDTLVALGHYYSGVVYYTYNEGSPFYQEMTAALSYLNKVEEWELMARCYNFLGISSVNRGNAAASLDYYINAMHYAKKADAKDFASMVLINIGALYNVCGRYYDAIENLQEAWEYFSHHPEHPKYEYYMVCIYQNMAKSYLCKGMLIESKCCFENIYSEHKECMDETARFVVWITEAMYYHIADNNEKYEDRIARVHNSVKNHLPIMDVFDDVYDYCRILLEREKDNEFWEIIHLLEPKAISVGITNLVRRILSLKLKYYRKRKLESEYLQEAVRYYEISEQIEVENKMMMNHALNIRRNLEKVYREKEEMERKNEILRRKSETDALTGLSNRFCLDNYAQDIFDKAIEKETSLAIEILDIDGFKEYNDYYGHQKGDECIRRIASVIKSMEEFGAFTARYGGDEFVLIYENITKDEAVKYMAELRKRVMKLDIEHQKSRVALIATISQGMCWDIPVYGNTIKDYIHSADEMLYRVKQKKRNNFCVGNLLQSSEQIVMSYL